MNRLKQLAVRIVGHDTTLGAHLQPSDLSEVTKLAPALVLGTVVAGVNAGIAAWQFSRGLPEPARVALTGLLALAGASVVMAIDRAALYHADIALAMSRGRMALVLALRVVLVLIVSLVTSQAVMPLLLAPELRAHALALREQREQARADALTTRAGIGGLKDERAEARTAIVQLQGQLERLPAPIQQRLDAARRCWSEHAAARQRAGNDADDAARARLAAKAAACRAQTRGAEAERDAHADTTRRALERARADDARLQGEIAGRQQAVDARVGAAAEVEAQALDERSAIVLSSLLATDRGAFFKWLLVSALLMSLELLPFALKLTAGQSSLGLAVAHRKLRLRDQLDVERQHRLDEEELAWRLRQLSLRAAEHLAQSPEAWAGVRREYAAHVAARAPLETVSAFLRQLDEEAERLQASLHRHPHYAAKIGAAWADAVDRAIAAMRGSAAAA